MPDLKVQRIFRAAALGVILGALAWIAKPGSDDALMSREPVVAKDEQPVLSSFLLFDSEASATPQIQPEQTGPLALQGLSWSGHRARVLVAVGGAAPVWLDQGQAIGDWTFVGPTAGGAQFSSPSGLFEVKPFVDVAAPQPGE